MEDTLRFHLDLIARGAVDIASLTEIEARLRDFLAGKRGPLRVKAGFDPTRPDLHFGHCVLLQKLRHFQDLGHTVIFLIGDYTALVGDPTGRNEARPRLTHEEVLASALTYQEQAFKVLDRGRTEVRYNSEWLGKLSMLDIIELTSKRTLARTLERRDFTERFEQHGDIYLHELLYPLLQGYDSVALDADVELGGTDQLFNLTVGRDLMARYGKLPQSVLTVPILEGLDARFLDGKIVGKKMSKSAGNCIGITEPPAEMFRKCMQVDDAILYRYFDLLSSLPAAEVAALRAAPDPLAHKRLFAIEMVTRFHDAEAAAHAEAEFQRIYLARDGIPEDIPEFSFPADDTGLWIAKALSSAHLAPSTSEGKRMIKQGWVEVDGVRVSDDTLRLAPGARYLLRTGSKVRRFAYVTITR
jgi:tyrosyl-tRNA synthetase